MTELTTSQLIKIILGIFVVVVVVLGIFLFFKGTVIDFFKNLMGDEEHKKVEEISQGEQNELEIPSRLCEDCMNDDNCRRKECTTISEELNKFEKKCDFVFKWNRKNNQCITINI